MVATVQKPGSQMTLSVYGNGGEIVSLAKRIKIMVPGGSKLTDGEAQALAQVSYVTNLNPFIGEVWYIPGRGPMIGIKGARRCGNEQVEAAGGKDAYWNQELTPCSAQEAGAPEGEKVAAAYKCIITDSVSTTKYQKMLLETIAALREAGSPDPVGDAKQIAGKRPEWIGYGYSTVAEQSKMNKQALAMKRAESDALKRKFYIPFGAEIAAGDTATETGAWIDAKAEDVPVEEVEEVPTEEPEKKPALQMYRYNDQMIINAVKKILNYSVQEAAATLHEAFKKKQIGLTLTVEEAEQFATDLITSK